MAQTRMKNGVYKKILIRIPPDILAALEEASTHDDRSINGELVHVLREWADQRQGTRERRVYIPASATKHEQDDSRALPPQRPRRATSASF